MKFQNFQNDRELQILRTNLQYDHKILAISSFNGKQSFNNLKINQRAYNYMTYHWAMAILTSKNTHKKKPHTHTQKHTGTSFNLYPLVKVQNFPNLELKQLQS